jgi:hypothetical protein
MKKSTIIAMCSVAMLSVGCQNLLEEDLKGKIVGNSALTTEEGLESALTGAYKGLVNTWGPGLVGGAQSDCAMGGDDMTCPATANQNEFEVLNISTASALATPVYQGCYKTIQGANNIIENYANTKGNQAKIKVIAGEAYFLRALSYYWVVRYYKDVPILTSSAFSFDLLKVKRSAPAEVYKLIEADLAMAESLLPNTKRDLGRPNVGSAKALLADVYLTQAGWPLKDNSKYALAAAKAKEVMDNKALYGFDLAPSIAVLFENDITKIGSPDLVKEEVFSLTTNQANGGVTHNTLGSYYLPGELGGWNVTYAELNFFLNFPEGPRKDATFATTYKKPDGTVVTWEQLSAKRPYFKKKWINANNPLSTWQSSHPWTLIRYAHVLTIYAEAKARSGGPDQLAYEAINSVRKRAGLAPLAGLSATQFADAVVQERAWEFAAENTRFFDLVRLELLKAANSKRHSTETFLDPGSITESDYTFPYPSSELLINPDL